MLKSYIGPKSFYRRAASIAIPMAVQSTLSSCMGIIDTMMVSRIGMVSAVGTATQIGLLVILVSLGVASGTAIFTSQFFGSKDINGIKKVFGLSVILTSIGALMFFIPSSLAPEMLIGLFSDDASVIENGAKYLSIVKYTFICVSLSFAYSFSYRAVQNTKILMYVGALSMVLNVILNYLLIFGNYGAPELGIEGAALATAIAQFAAIILYIIHSKKTNQIFIGSFTQMFRLKADFVKTVLKRIYPMIFNELMYGIGDSLFLVAFGLLGKVALDSYFISLKVGEIFFFIVAGMSNAGLAILGSSLGRGDIETARTEGRYFLGIATFLAIASATIILLFSEQFVMLFGIQSADVVENSILVVQVLSIKIALRMFIVVIFSSLRAGGDTKALAFLDSGIMWFVSLPIAFISVHFFGLREAWLLSLFINVEQIVRTILGLMRLKSGKWLNNLTSTIDTK